MVLSRSMAITRSKKVTDTEKRLKQLTQQLYGKEEGQGSVSRVQSTSNLSGGYSIKIDSASSSTAQVSKADVNYLTRDLLKIIAVASVLIAVQFVLKISVLK